MAGLWQGLEDLELCPHVFVSLRNWFELHHMLTPGSYLTTMAYALSFFLSIILRENMGFSVAEAQCLSAPQYVFAAIVIWLAAWVGDKWHIRGPVLLFACTLTYIGLPLMVSLCSTSSCVSKLTLVAGFRVSNRCSVLRDVSRGHWTDRWHSDHSGIPSKQHPRPLEARVCLGVIDRVRRHRWYCWIPGVQNAGQPSLPTGHLCGAGLHFVDCDPGHRKHNHLQAREPQGGSGRKDSGGRPQLQVHLLEGVQGPGYHNLAWPFSNQVVPTFRDARRKRDGDPADSYTINSRSDFALLEGRTHCRSETAFLTINVFSLVTKARSLITVELQTYFNQISANLRSLRNAGVVLSFHWFVSGSPLI